MSRTIDPRLLRALLDAKARLDAGHISIGEAAIEQLEALLDFPPTGIPLTIEGRQALEALLAAMRDYMEGDWVALHAFLGMPPP